MTQFEEKTRFEVEDLSKHEDRVQELTNILFIYIFLCIFIFQVFLSSDMKKKNHKYETLQEITNKGLRK